MTMFEVLGASGCGATAYIIPIYALWLLMLGAIGFGLGVATHWAVSGLARQSRQRDG